MAVIDIQHLAKHFGQVKAVDGISFSVEKGEVFGFLGPNGAGKTTTIRCLMDFIRPTSGNIKLFDLDSYRDSVKIKQRVGYLSGYVRFHDGWTGREHIEYFRRFDGHGRDSADKLIADLEFDPTKKAGTLSSGNKQKLGIILAFMHDPDLLVLDEPTTALDPLLQNTVYELLNERVKRGATVFFSSHNLPEVERVCHRVGIIRRGKMAAVETIEDLRAKKVYRVEVRIQGDINRADFTLPNVSLVDAPAGHLFADVRGDIMPLMSALTKYNVRDLSVERAPLEQIFMEYYE